jgi:hypothetical protein
MITITSALWLYQLKTLNKRLSLKQKINKSNNNKKFGGQRIKKIFNEKKF